MGKSTIQWCDYTFNPWIGCRMAKTVAGQPIEECFHCYAKTLDDNRYSRTLDGGTKEHPVSHWGSGPRHRTSVSNWKQPLRWNRKAAEEAQRWNTEHAGGMVQGLGLTSPPHRPRVFCGSLCDWLDDENVPIEWTADLLKLIHDTPHLDWLLLTKRPQNWADRINSASVSLIPYCDFDMVNWIDGWWGGNAPANVWIGVSAGADQAAALAIPARVHFLSCEPMLQPMDTTHAGRFDWIIFGGESGSKARRLKLEWIYEGIRFCRNYGVAPFVKQLGGNLSDEDSDYCARESGRSMHDSHGGDMEEWPQGVRAREFPIVSRQNVGTAVVPSLGSCNLAPGASSL